MHASLRDAYSWKAKASEIVLLSASTLFAATTFAGDDLYRFFGAPPEAARILLGVASLLAFMASIVTMVADWRGMAAKHATAFTNFSEVLALFNGARTADGAWPEHVRQDLHRAYWAACGHSVSIPEGQFTRLKAKHQRKLRVSRLLDHYPWCPRFVLAIALMWKDSVGAVREARAREEG